MRVNPHPVGCACPECLALRAARAARKAKALGPAWTTPATPVTPPKAPDAVERERAIYAERVVELTALVERFVRDMAIVVEVGEPEDWGTLLATTEKAAASLGTTFSKVKQDVATLRGKKP